MLERPDRDTPGRDNVRPGLHAFGSDPSGYGVVWWDPRRLGLTVQPLYGLRRDDLIQDPGRGIVERDRARYDQWLDERRAAQERGAQPSIRLRTATDWARSRRDGDDRAAIAREVELVAVTPALPDPRATLRDARSRDAGDRRPRRDGRADRRGREPAGAHPRRAGGRSGGGVGGRERGACAPADGARPRGVAPAVAVVRRRWRGASRMAHWSKACWISRSRTRRVDGRGLQDRCRDRRGARHVPAPGALYASIVARATGTDVAPVLMRL